MSNPSYFSLFINQSRLYLNIIRSSMLIFPTWHWNSQTDISFWAFPPPRKYIPHLTSTITHWTLSCSHTSTNFTISHRKPSNAHIINTVTPTCFSPQRTIFKGYVGYIPTARSTKWVTRCKIHHWGKIYLICCYYDNSVIAVCNYDINDLVTFNTKMRSIFSFTCCQGGSTSACFYNK